MNLGLLSAIFDEIQTKFTINDLAPKKLLGELGRIVSEGPLLDVQSN